MQKTVTRGSDYRQAAHDIHPQFPDRWSPRSFLTKDVPDDILYRIFEAARWAPSANNRAAATR